MRTSTTCASRTHGRGGVEGLDKVVDLDSQHRALLAEVERVRADQNRASKAIGKASPEDRPTAIAQAKELSDKLKSLEPELEKVAEELKDAAVVLPNFPHESVPVGAERR